MQSVTKMFVGAACGAAMAVSSSATIIVNDNFDRADGSLVGTAPTPGPGGVWANHSGTAGDLLISSGQAVVQHGVPSEDANVSFGAVSTGLLSANFDVTVTDDTVIGGSDFEYFAHFFEVGSFNFRSRLDVVAPTAAGDYTFGIASGSSTAETIFPTDFSFGTPVNVTLLFDIDAGIGSLDVGGTTISGTGTFLGETLDGFALRQSDSSNNETVFVDNLVVDYIPEPSTFALLGIGGLVALLRRRVLG